MGTLYVPSSVDFLFPSLGKICKYNLIAAFVMTGTTKVHATYCISGNFHMVEIFVLNYENLIYKAHAHEYLGFI